MNENYWKNFYKQNPELNSNSSFSEFVLSKIEEKDTILDLGCGNGKDTYFFKKNKIKVTGIDKNPSLKEDFFIIGDVFENVFESKNYYMRFFVHAVEEEYLDSLLDKIYNISSTGAKIYIETRSTKEITEKEKLLYNFKSGVGDLHKRMLYSCEYLQEKISKNFKIEFVKEGKGFSKFAGKDPYLIRIIATKE